MDELRNEIIESEKARVDLLKWKLVIVAALGAVGLGVNASQGPIRLVLIGIPLVCFYVDLLCYHIDLRIQVIGAFIRSHSPDKGEQTIHDYELFVTKHRDAFALESGALSLSTRSLSAGILLYGAGLVRFAADSREGIPLAIAGVVGIILSFVAHRRYQRRLGCIT